MLIHFHGEINFSWCNATLYRLTWALAIYRQTMEAGALPTVETLSRLLGCLRKPEISTSTATGFEDRTLTFFGQPPPPPQPPAPTPSLDGFDGFGIYDPRALSLFEVPFFYSPICIALDQEIVFKRMCFYSFKKNLQEFYDTSTDYQVCSHLLTQSV